MKIKDNRFLSFVIVFLVYAVATAVGVIVYNALNTAFYLSFLIADIVATVVTFVFSLAFKNASVYDPYWSVLPIVVVCFYATETAFTVAKLLPFIAVVLWGIRLTANWAYTFHGLNHQDWRYTMLREKTGILYPFVNFFGIHLFPTLVVYACMLPVTFTFNMDFNINAGSIIFFCLSICAVVLQGVSDFQMHVYRKNKTTPFIRTGLWKYSRHPNYLGEILMWWGIALAFMCAVPSMWYLCAGALVNNLMFIFISIPLADKRQSAKEGFNEYKKATRMLLPLKR